MKLERVLTGSSTFRSSTWRGDSVARWMLVRAIAVWLILGANLHAADDDEEPRALPEDVAELARRYAGITEWRGFFDSSTAGASSWGNPHFSVNGFRQLEARASGRFSLKRSSHGWDPKRGDFSWVVANGEPGEATGVEYDQFSLKEGYSGESEEWRREISGTVPMLMTEFSISLTKQLVHLHPGHAPDNQQPKGARTGRRISQASSANGQRRFTTQPIEEAFRGSLRYWMARSGAPQDKENASQEWATIRNGPGVMTFVYQSVGAYASGANAPECRHRSRVILFPVYDDLEVEVTIKGYETWRPEGSIAKPAEPGNSLLARATLKTKSGKVADLPMPKRFKFDLLDTSREPGVCMNWPLQAKDNDYDLRLAAESEGKLSDADQTLVISEPLKDEKEQPFAEAKVQSYDFGGRATLLVVCELDDGREIMGLIKTGSGEEEFVRLPKMIGPDWVAENWRKENDAEKLPALHDEEKVEGQEHNGDGFTLYQEYRGWVQQGKHIEGDPLKKDFFVRNAIGADAKGGIALFERVSKLKVHSQLRASELVLLPMRYLEAEAHAKGERIMNLNHRDAPHRVDQHAVVLINTSGYGSRGGGTDAVSNGDKTDRAFRPGKVQLIHLEEPGRSNGIFSRKASTTDYNLSERDAAFAYDRGVAHELLHSVGVDHHGEGQEPRTFYFQGAGDPMNTLHRPRFVPYMPSSGSDFGKMVFGKPAVWSDFDRGPTITLKWEDTQEDVAQSVSAYFERELTAERKDPLYERDGGEQAAKYPQYGRDAAFWSEMAIYSSVAGGATKRGILNTEAHRFDRFVTIGRTHEADSGNELCLMRYYFANAYPVDGAENTFYLVRPGMNRAGRDLCKSPEGTGANAHTHDPKSRFGDSAAGRGNCFRYICPNDAIPGRNL